jgi:hypothetical protein
MAMVVTTAGLLMPTVPLSSPLQVVPFQRAMLLAPGTPPASVKLPPTYTSVPLMAMVVTTAGLLMPTVPLSSPLHVVPFQRAM